MIPFARIVQYGNRLPVSEVEKILIQAQYTNVMIQVGSNLYGYGVNNVGQLGVGSSTYVPTMRLLKSDVDRYYLGALGTIIIGTDSKIYFAGSFQLFPQAGSRTSWFDVSSIFLAVGLTAENIRTIELAESMRILSTDGRMFYTGRNDYSECGVLDKPINTLTLSTVSDIAKIRGSINGTHIILNNGNALYCGLNSQGEAGLGDTIRRSTPTLVTTDVHEVCAMYQATQWYKNDGTTYYSGYGSYGQLSTPLNTSVRSITLNTSISAFDFSNYFFVSSDKGNASGVGPIIMDAGNSLVKQSGINSNGRIGRGDVGGSSQLTLYSIPLDILGGYDNVKAVFNYIYATFILTKDDKLYACGGNTLNGTLLPDGSSNVPSLKFMDNMPWY